MEYLIDYVQFNNRTALTIYGIVDSFDILHFFKGYVIKAADFLIEQVIDGEYKHIRETDIDNISDMGELLKEIAGRFNEKNLIYIYEMNVDFESDVSIALREDMTSIIFFKEQQSGDIRMINQFFKYIYPNVSQSQIDTIVISLLNNMGKAIRVNKCDGDILSA